MTEPIPTRERVVVRAYQPGDEAGIVACYNKVFPTADGRIPQRTLAHWRWKFAANPVAQHHITVAADQLDGGIVATYAAIPLRVWAEGREQIYSQTADLVVLPRFRNYGGRPGLFAQIGRLHTDLYVGDEPGQAVFTYGMPVPAWRSGQKYLNYILLLTWDILFRETPSGFTPRAMPGDLEVVEVPRYGADLDALWASMRGELALATIRDQVYMNWRYADCPDVRYRLFECRERRTGKLRGVCVYCVSDWMRPNTGYIADWLAPASDQDVTAAMLGHCEKQVADAGVQVLAAHFSHVDPRFLGFQRLGFQVIGNSYFITVITKRFDTVAIRDRWYLTLGDSDLV